MSKVVISNSTTSSLVYIFTPEPVTGVTYPFAVPAQSVLSVSLPEGLYSHSVTIVADGSSSGGFLPVHAQDGYVSYIGNWDWWNVFAVNVPDDSAPVSGSGLTDVQFGFLVGAFVILCLALGWLTRPSRFRL